SISTWEDLTTHFLAQFFPPGRTTKLQNDILMFQQHQGESLSEAWTHFKNLLQKVPHHGIDLWLQVQIFYDHGNPATRRTINQLAGDYRKSKIAVGEGVTRSIFGVNEIDLGEEVGNMWESEDLIENRIDCNKPPKRGDGARHAKIRLIDPDGEEFTKTFQSIPTTRNFSEKENPSKIIDLDHFHDS
ncbi:zinc finger, CCHC-type containing protein, partial [Tanacetum coccineum]